MVWARRSHLHRLTRDTHALRWGSCATFSKNTTTRLRTRTHANTHKPTNKPTHEQLKNFVACSALVEMKQEGSEFLIALKVNGVQRNVRTWRRIYSHDLAFRIAQFYVLVKLSPVGTVGAHWTPSSWLSLLIGMYVCVYIYTHVHIHIHIHRHINLYICICMYVYI